jgi:hypothetical protein
LQRFRKNLLLLSSDTRVTNPENGDKNIEKRKRKEAGNGPIGGVGPERSGSDILKENRMEML